MTRIENIYELVFSRLPECQKSDEELMEKVEKEVKNMDCTEDERKRLLDAMYIGSSYGQSNGFVSEFRFAIVLMAECLMR